MSYTIYDYTFICGRFNSHILYEFNDTEIKNQNPK